MAPSKPKVAHVLIPYLRKTETFIYDRLINHKRYAPFILTDEPVINADMFPFGNPIYSLAERPQAVRVADTFFKKTFSVSPYFQTILKRREPAVIHAHFGPVGAVVAPVAKALGIPLIVSFYGVDASSLIDQPEYQSRYKKLFRQAAVVSVLSGEMAKRLVAGGCPEGKIRIHHLAVDTAAIRRRPERSQTEEGRFRIVSAGRFVPKKGMALLVSSFEILTKSVPGAELVIYGDGPLEESVKKQVAEKRLGKRITFCGHKGRGEVLSAMREADAFALFSVTGPDGDQEGTPTVLIEAGASGLPSVSTNHAGIPEVIEDGHTGFLVDENEVERFAARLEQLALHPRLRVTMGRAARNRIKSEFDIHKVMSAIESDYDSLRK